MAAITNDKFWNLLETPPANAAHTNALYEWSLNFDTQCGPITLFLDLIGYSMSEFDTPLYDMKSAALGYLELDYLGDALKEYATNPQAVMAWLEQLMAAEVGE